MRYQRREIGETEWEDCTQEQYNAARRDPTMDMRIIEEVLSCGPSGAVVITEADIGQKAQ